MSILDTNVVRLKSKSGQYWAGQSTSVGEGVALSVAGYKRIKFQAKVSNVTGRGASIYFFGSLAGTVFNTDKARIQVLNENTRERNSDHDIRTNGTYFFTVDVKKYDSLGIGLTVSGTATVVLDYILSDDDDESLDTQLFKDEAIENMNHLITDDDYIIWGDTSTSNRIAALYQNVACRNKLTSLDISYTGIKGKYKNIAVNNTNFPNLVGTSITHVMIIPFTRNIPLTTTSSTQQSAKEFRICVVFDNGQVYHNYPARGTSTSSPDGTYVNGDEYLFDESVIWELEGRKYPSKTVTDSNYLKNPCLADTSYTMYPPISTSNSDYANGGFADTTTRKTTAGVDKTFVRFYTPTKTTNAHSMRYMGGYEPNKKVTFLGTYSSNNSTATATRICIFATSDGGRQWFCKYEFGQTNLAQVWGQAINSSSLPAMSDSTKLYICKRTNNVPSAGTPIPSTKFTIGSDIVVNSISSSTTAVVSVAAGHGLVNGDVVFFKTRTSTTNDNWDWIINDTATTNSKGTGLFFRVIVSGNNISLYEHIWNPDNNISCRHIHSINHIKDGIIIGCGETYPEGWLLFCSIRSADVFAVVQAQDDMTIQRLTSSNVAIQRPLGCLFLDDADNNIIFASDNENTSRTAITTASGASFMRSSTGLFKGKFSDIDDISKFTCILESPDVCYFFKEILGVWIFYGQRGHLAISKDRGTSWKHYEMPSISWGYSRFLGVSKNKEIGIEGMLIKLK